MKNRGRPKKARLIKGIPEINQFSPRGKAGRPDEVELSLEGLEAIRLADFEGKNQVDAALFMGISQQTFSRILRKARKDVSEALVCGKRIRVIGGTYKLAIEGTRTEKDRTILLELATKFKGKSKAS